jgi:hypothetical protein
LSVGADCIPYQFRHETSATCRSSIPQISRINWFHRSTSAFTKPLRSSVVRIISAEDSPVPVSFAC